jgi:hypothetical protein
LKYLTLPGFGSNSAAVIVERLEERDIPLSDSCSFFRVAAYNACLWTGAKASDVTLPSEVAYEGSVTRNVAQRAWCGLLSSLPDLQ